MPVTRKRDRDRSNDKDKANCPESDQKRRPPPPPPPKVTVLFDSEDDDLFLSPAKMSDVAPSQHVEQVRTPPVNTTRPPPPLGRNQKLLPAADRPADPPAAVSYTHLTLPTKA